MANYMTTDTDLTAVANAIRTKGGTSGSLEYPEGFVSAINAIPVEPTLVVPKDVNFYDYDGELLYSYTAQEAQALSALPASPSHSRLTFQEWNWTLAQIKSQLTNVPECIIDVGATYVTTSGYTEVDITLTAPLLSPVFCVNVSEAITIDWGDGSSETSVSTSNSAQYIKHVYSVAGSYTVKFKNGEVGFTSGNGRSFILDSESPGSLRTYTMAYSDVVTNMHIGSNFRWISNGIRWQKNLRTITIPKGTSGTSSIGVNRMQSIKCIVIPSDITSVGGFDKNFGLEVICISPAMTSFSIQMLVSDSKLRNVTIPESVTTIGSYSIFGLSNVKKIVIPSTVTSISTAIFETAGNYSYACESLELLKYLCPASALASSFTGKKCTRFPSLKKCVLPTGLTSIESSFFSGCVSLEEVTIPNTVTSIGEAVFKECYSLKELTIPSAVTSIGSGAFQGAANHGIHMLPTTPPTIGTNVFADSNDYLDSNLFKIYVPRSTGQTVLTAYQTASGWSDYAAYMQEEPE